MVEEDKMIKFKCAHCHSELMADEENAGRIALCPECKKEIQVPQKLR